MTITHLLLDSSHSALECAHDAVGESEWNAMTVNYPYSLEEVRPVIAQFRAMGLSSLVINRLLGRNIRSLKDLGRLTESDLQSPAAPTALERLRQKRSQDEFIGKYVIRDLHRDQAIDSGSVSPRADFKDVAVTPVLLAAEPDQHIINQGTLVEVVTGAARKPARVLAVITAEGKWFAVFRSAEIGDVAKAEPKLGRVLALPTAASLPPPPEVKPSGQKRDGKCRGKNRKRCKGN